MRKREVPSIPGLGARPFKVTYLTKSGRKVGRIAACGSPEGVVRTASVRVLGGEAAHAYVYLVGELFAEVHDDGRKLELRFI